ncbi:MAG: GNAT family N-acetyltransferase [Ilumatobacter sp.]|uniref:GNAT family N-acetyltransferase n=1 Tax=Ilumatobacter sp. TaxID=1967498 RepID=UPI0032983079
MAEPDSLQNPHPDDSSGSNTAPGDSNRDDLAVVDVPDASRFELRRAGERVGLADYSVSGNVVTVPHVETDPAHRGQGFAAALMAGVIDSVRTNGQTIRPVCPYAAAYVQQHPDTHDLLADGSTV